MDANNIRLGARIVVIGVGGAGTNAVNSMLDESTNIEYFVMNTDNQSLDGSRVQQSHRIVLGEELTRGLGTGGNPEIGRQAAEQSIEQIHNIVRGANMVFIAAGMGGGTGTGAAPVIAQACRDENALTVAVVTRPFNLERRRIETSIKGLNDLREAVDAIVVVSNDKLLINNGSEFVGDAFKKSDDVLKQCVNIITDLILMPGYINLDFADIRSVLENAGLARIGVGMGEGPNKAYDAANAAINSPLLETPIEGARRLICSVTCGPKVSLADINKCVNYVTETASKDPDVKLGVSYNDQIDDRILISVIACDFEGDHEFTVEDYQKQSIVKKIETFEEDKENDTSSEDILPSFLKDKNIE